MTVPQQARKDEKEEATENVQYFPYFFAQFTGHDKLLSCKARIRLRYKEIMLEHGVGAFLKGALF